MTAEEYPAVLGLLIRGLATQSGFADNAREILRHVGHPHPEVRAAVAFAFEGSTDHEDHEDHKDREALQDVLTLARDPYAEVRRGTPPRRRPPVRPHRPAASRPRRRSHRSPARPVRP
ncbi:hypothetical protein OG272_31920 [Streptomyces sp. NBC_00104]|uniref:hypothetical protein n=1 Tax=unclassified Streptomyces TaxID=2593676 RepID=UPI002E2214A1